MKRSALSTKETDYERERERDIKRERVLCKGGKE